MLKPIVFSPNCPSESATCTPFEQSNILVVFKFELERLAVLQMAPLGWNRKTPTLKSGKRISKFESNIVLNHNSTQIYVLRSEGCSLIYIADSHITKCHLLSHLEHWGCYPQSILQLV